MDSRLFLLGGRRLSRLRKTDVPLLVRALIAVLRKRAHLGSGFRQGVGYVRIWDSTFEMYILGQDWELIFPLIQDGSFDPLLTPTNHLVGYSDPKVSFKDVLDLADRPLYQHIFGLVEPLFPV